MKIFIFGNKGNMGRRYTAILRELGHKVYGADIDDPQLDLNQFDGFIIATPTSTHLEYIDFLKPFNKPILCEKPIINKAEDLPKLVELMQERVDISMVSQYDYYLLSEAKMKTVYNYYNHGKDGLAWDCINIIWPAKDQIILNEYSPIWECVINGMCLNLGKMDQAYIDNIKAWISGETKYSTGLIYDKHCKVIDYLNGNFS